MKKIPNWLLVTVATLAVFLVLLVGWPEQTPPRVANVSYSEFKQLAERVSGKQLDGLFRAWLYSGHKPAPTAANGL